MYVLTSTGGDGIQSPQHPHSPTRQMLNHPPPTPRRIRHQLAQESPLRDLNIHNWQRFDPMVLVHFHLSASDRQHLEAANLWRTALHGSPRNGRDDDLGDLRQPRDRPIDSPDPIHHREENDERSTPISTGGSRSLHLQSSVRLHHPSTHTYSNMSPA